MTGQLLFVGIYLKYVFDLNNYCLNLLWVVLMTITGAFTIIKRSSLRYKYFILPVTIAIVGGLLLNIIYFKYVILIENNFFNARYVIPIVGMIIGNEMTSSIVGIRSFYQSLQKNEDQYKYYLMCGATRSEALFPFIKSALRDSASPTIANTATIGLIWLPGMMTGQILGGSLPTTAIKYQIMIMIAIFSGGVITTFLSLYLSKRFVFNSFDVLDKNIFLKK